MTDTKKIDDARKTLGLGEFATMEEIQSAYRQKAMLFHPDRCGGYNKDTKDCEHMYQKVTAAYETLMAYCAGYHYSFKEKDIKKNTLNKAYYDHLRKYYDGWWGDLDL